MATENLPPMPTFKDQPYVGSLVPEQKTAFDTARAEQIEETVPEIGRVLGLYFPELAEEKPEHVAAFSLRLATGLRYVFEEGFQHGLTEGARLNQFERERAASFQIAVLGGMG